MKLFGIPLRKPGPLELTGACAMAVGLWVGLLGLLKAAQVEVEAADAGALLMVIAWGCVSVRLGIQVSRGRRHMVANFMVSGMLLAAYQALLAIAP